MPLPTTYSTGTATVNGNETAVAGQGTTWLTSGLQAGDLFWAGGMSVRIASVNSNTSLTLAFPWPGASRAAQQYEVRFTPDATRILASARELLSQLSNGNLASLAAQAGSAGKLPYFSGPGVFALADLSDFVRNFLYDTTGPAIFAKLGGGTSLSAGGYVQLPNGVLIQWGRIPQAGAGGFSQFFPIGFPNACFQVVASPDNGNYIENVFYVGIDASSIDRFGFGGNRKFVGGSGGVGASGGAAYFIAVGY